MAKKAKSLIGRIVEVTWEDAWYGGNYYTAGELERETPCIQSNVGYVLRDNADGITLGVLKVLDSDRYKHAHHICRAMVRKVEVLK